jgi:nucleolar protein 56
MSKSNFKLLFVLHETALGYVMTQCLEFEEVGRQLQEVDAITDLSKFGKIVKVTSYLPFANSADALENANHLAEGMLVWNVQIIARLHYCIC